MKISQAACSMSVHDSLKYTDANCQCFHTVLMEFNEVPGRTNPNIGSIPKDPISVLNFADLNMWLTEQKKSWINLYQEVPCYGDF